MKQVIKNEYDSLTFAEQCKVALNAKNGSKWINRKSGIPAWVDGHCKRGVLLRRDRGGVTLKQHHYFAYDYFPAHFKN